MSTEDRSICRWRVRNWRNWCFYWWTRAVLWSWNWKNCVVIFVNTVALIVHCDCQYCNTFRNYFERFAKKCGLIKFFGVPLNQTLKKTVCITIQQVLFVLPICLIFQFTTFLLIRAFLGTRLFGLADSVCPFQSEPFRSREFFVPVSRHFGRAMKSYVHFLMQTYSNQGKLKKKLQTWSKVHS